MGQDIELTASDKFQLGAYRADPASAPKGAVVVIQEIFGVNHHIRSVCDRLAGEGYVAIAPSIFDRTAPGSSPAIRPMRSRMRENSSPIRIGTPCCGTLRPRSMR